MKDSNKMHIFERHVLCLVPTTKLKLCTPNAKALEKELKGNLKPLFYGSLINLFTVPSPLSSSYSQNLPRF